jgi:hypothetical protein
MACQAIKRNLSCCHNWATNNNRCHVHQRMSDAEFQHRWFQKYILAQKDSQPFYYRFAEQKRKYIEKAFRIGDIRFTPALIQSIPSISSYLDVYVLLLELGAIQYDWNEALYHEAIKYVLVLCRLQSPNEKGQLYHTPTSKNICTQLLLKDSQTFYRFLLEIPKCIVELQEDFFPYHHLSIWLTYLLTTDVVRELCWMPKNGEIVRHYATILGSQHPLTKYMDQRWLPELVELYRTEKQIQRAIMDHCKEELMMVVWHPERLMKRLDAASQLAGYEIGIEDL